MKDRTTDENGKITLHGWLNVAANITALVAFVYFMLIITSVHPEL